MIDGMISYQDVGECQVQNVLLLFAWPLKRFGE